MQKKLQVFISSTFIDLQEERQAAVQAVLNAGHIPAGMELFKAGDISQKETIKRWIEESDIYMLILGGRYGSIDEETGKSYTHWEYDYAGQLGKPRFAVVIKDDALKEKASKYGPDVFERENYKKYQEFKSVVLSKISKFYSDLKDIKLAVLESLKDYEKDESLFGWISGKELKDTNSLREDNYELLKENTELRKQLEIASKKNNKAFQIDGTSFEEIQKCLKQQVFHLDHFGIEDSGHADEVYNAYELFTIYSEDFINGITNHDSQEEFEMFLFGHVYPILLQFNLVEKVNVRYKGYSCKKAQASKEGLRFLRWVLLGESK
ncbi:hypothetical protein COK92_08500 [Bacillus anthracis]|nr:hypothetical protein COJ44_28080 [Bacillus anthracis]PFU94840.1 hypothetical protein COK92_08500 [Bacillus anthracis]